MKPEILDMNHALHNHLLNSEYSPTLRFICDGCKELGYRTCFYCPKRDCKFILHAECTLLTNPLYFPSLCSGSFEFNHDTVDSPVEKICDACARDIKGWSYACPRHHLHPSCAKLPEKIIGLGKEKVNLLLTRKIPSKCLKCNHKKNSPKRVRGLSYASDCSKYCFHVACVRDLILEAWTTNINICVVGNDNGSSSLLYAVLSNFLNDYASSSNNNARTRTAALKKVVAALKFVVSVIIGDPVHIITQAFESITQCMDSN